jgi:hypothetical protein
MEMNETSGIQNNAEQGKHSKGNSKEKQLKEAVKNSV